MTIVISVNVFGNMCFHSEDVMFYIGKHYFKYAIYPHKGSFLESDVVKEGMAFNIPLITKYESGN
jgi:alpha-mannosidase